RPKTGVIPDLRPLAQKRFEFPPPETLTGKKTARQQFQDLPPRRPFRTVIDQRRFAKPGGVPAKMSGGNHFSSRPAPGQFRRLFRVDIKLVPKQPADRR